MKVGHSGRKTCQNRSGTTSITIKTSTKLKLEELKSKIQLELGKSLSWNSFFEEIIKRFGGGESE